MEQFKCRINGSSLKRVVDFGMQPLGNGFLTPDQYSSEYFYPMTVGFSETSFMFQLLNQPNPEMMFHDNYAFYSSTSSQMAKHFQNFFNQVVQSGYLSKNDPFVVVLGCNAKKFC